MKNITILVNGSNVSICGCTNVGKSHVLYLLKQSFKKEVLCVEHENDMDFEDEEQFDNKIGKVNDIVIKNLNEKITISIIDISEDKKEGSINLVKLIALVLKNSGFKQISTAINNLDGNFVFDINKEMKIKLKECKLGRI